MPLYDYECKCGNRQEAVFKVEKKPDYILCDKCGQQAKKVPCIGGIQSDSPVWLDNSVRAALQNPNELRTRREKPIETRTELKRYLKQNDIIATG